MKDIKVLVSACGAPGCSTLIRQLKNVKERNITIIGTDIDQYAIGRFLADEFYIGLPANDPLYIARICEIIKMEEIDIFFCVSSAEVEIVSMFKGFIEKKFNCKVLVSDHEGIVNVVNKYTLYFRCMNLGLRVPRFALIKSYRDFEANIDEIEKNDMCFKPIKGKGSRGFRRITISDIHQEYDTLMYEKPINKTITLTEVTRLFKYADANGIFEPILLMEYKKGTPYDCMTLCKDGEAIFTSVKTREKERWGIITQGTLIKDIKLETICKQIVKEFNLSYNISIQFIDDFIIEVNPRTSTYIYGENVFNEPYFAIKLALGEHEDIEIFKYTMPYGRKMIRYMDQEFFYDNSNSSPSYGRL